MVLLLAVTALAGQTSLETDAIVDLFGGASLQVRRSGVLAGRLSAGVQLLRINVPDHMLDEYNGADGLGWDVYTGLARVLLDYSLGAPNKGVSIGIFVSI